jgi:predicted ATPase
MINRVRVKNFGPVKEGYAKEDGWLDIKKVTMFIGNQGSGKSTVAKLLSTMTWIEKALVRDTHRLEWFEQENKLKELLAYHRLENYFEDNTIIEYEGLAYGIKYQQRKLEIIKRDTGASYPLPQIMYVPAERNFITYVRTPKELKITSASLQDFLTEYNEAKNSLQGLVGLPINDAAVKYDKQRDMLNVEGQHYKVELTEASSGFQSLVPLYLVSWYLSHTVGDTQGKATMSNEEKQRFKQGVDDIWHNENLTDEQKRIALSALSSKFNKTAFINIVEEPEQNLFPASQWNMLQSLLQFNKNKTNRLVITTHSPYIINYLSIAIQGKYLEALINKSAKREKLLPELYKIIPEEALIAAGDVVIYQLNEEDGSIHKLDAVDGIPSDKNYLNDRLADGNNVFDVLLEIEQEL